MINHSPLNDRGVILWLTGLSGAGKTTIAQQLEHKLREGDRPASDDAELASSLAIADEMLLVALEYLHQEQSLGSL